MNEIVTPPGYVEYPRDPKFRKVDDLDRLELMAEGYPFIKVVPFAIPIYFLFRPVWPINWLSVGALIVGAFLYWICKQRLGQIYSELGRVYQEALRYALGFMMIAVFNGSPSIALIAMGCCLFWSARFCLQKIYAGKGWNKALSTYVSLAVSLLEVIHGLKIFPFWLSLYVSLASLLVVAFHADWLVRHEFRLHGLKLPINIWKSKPISMVKSLRLKESPAMPAEGL